MHVVFVLYSYQFYADDRADTSDVIKTHSFGGVQAARFVRIVVSSGVRWIGHEEKCFRFEILGCVITSTSSTTSTSFVPSIDFSSASLPSGFLSAKWFQPEVVIAGRERVSLDVDHFLVTASVGGAKEFYNTTYMTFTLEKHRLRS